MAETDSRGPGAADTEFAVTRVFDAPRETVFKAWTEIGHLKNWWGPKGFALRTCVIDLRPGGVFHYGMQPPTAGIMWGKWVFREIVAPERLVFVASFSDEAGGVARNPWVATWPLETLSTVTFDEDGGRTTLTMRGVPLDATEAEQATFKAGRGPMRQGWAGTLDQLASYLRKA